MATIEDLMKANLLSVFNERDGERRREAIARTYVADVRFTDPEETVVGHEALDAKAERLLAESPEFAFTPEGSIHVVDDLGYLAWSFGPLGKPPVVRGADIALVNNGLITRVYTLLLAG
ncbi:nuclear transport factor 2 family protein [Asanoa sp. NPDC049518]|uniref:nuclear transport factor 2 family protein n=1 Tax=unclassified Asanoa TaxID=2685164 RepID=UPI003418E26A